MIGRTLSHWVTFHIPDDPQHPVFVAPFRNRKVPDESEWIRVKDGTDEVNVPWWSPDGNLLYWLMSRDGFACIWARRLDPSTKAPKGDAFAVLHLHEARRSMAGNGSGGFSPALARDKLILALPEDSSNIWIAEQESAK